MHALSLLLLVIVDDPAAIVGLAEPMSTSVFKACSQNAYIIKAHVNATVKCMLGQFACFYGDKVHIIHVQECLTSYLAG